MFDAKGRIMASEAVMMEDRVLAGDLYPARGSAEVKLMGLILFHSGKS